LEELIVSQNYLTRLPSSIGLLRRLHTLNLDENDVDALPPDLGSCVSLRILSAHANRLTTLPAELDHIDGLGVINLTANLVKYLPVSFMKLRNITALWLSENQTKPLIQLNQDTDPETGQRVLTNFLLPQQRDVDDRLDAVSESGSFHASVWEEERAQRATVRWAGDERNQQEAAADKASAADLAGGRLRREPTPFPKEMRAMAKRVQNMRSGKEEISTSSSSRQRKASRRPSQEGQHQQVEHCQPDVRHHQMNGHAYPSIAAESVQRSYFGQTDLADGIPVAIKEAVVSKPQVPGPLASEKICQDEKNIREQLELQQFEELERSLNISQPCQDSSSSPNERQEKLLAEGRRVSDKSSRDSGVITPSELSNNSPNETHRPSPSATAHLHQGRKPSDPLPAAPSPSGQKQMMRPPPYHVAAAMSKRAADFSHLSSTTMGSSDRGSDSSPAPSSTAANDDVSPAMRSAAPTDTASMSGHSEVSTAASSLQTIVKSPLHATECRNGGVSFAVSESRITTLRKTSAPVGSTPVVDQEAKETAAHAMRLRKVSEQLLSNPRTRQSLTGIPMLNRSRPGSYASPKGVALATAGSSPSPSTTTASGNSPLPTSVQRPSSQLSFIPVMSSSAAATPPPRVPSGGNELLSTIEHMAANSDDELPNYENFTGLTQSTARVPAGPVGNGGGQHTDMAGDRISTNKFVISPLSSTAVTARASRIPTPSSAAPPAGHSRLPKPVSSPR